MFISEVKFIYHQIHTYLIPNAVNNVRTKGINVAKQAKKSVWTSFKPVTKLNRKTSNPLSSVCRDEVQKVDAWLSYFTGKRMATHIQNFSI